MTLLELESAKQTLLNEVKELITLKKQLYSNVDIESPMSTEEKELNNQIANIWSQINSIVIEKRKLIKQLK